MAAGFNTLEVPVEEAAELLRVQPQTIRSRLRAGNLQNKREGRRVRSDVVVIDPQATWLSSADAGALLGVTTSTVHALLARGELAGVRQKGGRWRVRLQSVLENPRCDPEIVARFGGEPQERPRPGPDPRPDSSPRRLRRAVHVELEPEESDLLDRLVDVHGTQVAAVAAGLRAAEVDAAPGELAELRLERDLYREQAERSQARAAAIAELARRHHVDEVYCPRCDKLVPIAEAGYVVEESGAVAIYHEPHGHHSGGRLRSSTVMARRLEAAEDDDEEAVSG